MVCCGISCIALGSFCDGARSNDAALESWAIGRGGGLIMVLIRTLFACLPTLRFADLLSEEVATMRICLSKAWEILNWWKKPESFIACAWLSVVSARSGEDVSVLSATLIVVILYCKWSSCLSWRRCRHWFCGLVLELDLYGIEFRHHHRACANWICHSGVLLGWSSSVNIGKHQPVDGEEMCLVHNPSPYRSQACHSCLHGVQSELNVQFRIKHRVFGIRFIMSCSQVRLSHFPAYLGSHLVMESMQVPRWYLLCLHM